MLTKRLVGFVGFACFFISAYKGATEQMPILEVIIIMFISTSLISIWAFGAESSYKKLW